MTTVRVFPGGVGKRQMSAPDQSRTFGAEMHMSGYSVSCRGRNYLSPISTPFAATDNPITPANVSAPGC